MAGEAKCFQVAKGARVSGIPANCRRSKMVAIGYRTVKGKIVKRASSQPRWIHA